MPARRLGIRWTIGDVSARGFEALRLSIWGAYRLFGPDATYTVCVNTIGVDRARTLTKSVPAAVCFMDANPALPAWLRPHLDPGLAQGVAWKFAPLSLFTDRHELSLDNDCILWSLPPAIAAWLRDAEAESVLLAEDVCSMLGQFSELCGPVARNTGIRGIPEGFALEHALRAVLREHPVTLVSELDEQGLQVAALQRARRVHVVRVQDVSICSPFPPHIPALGRSGAHFVGLNARKLGWDFEGQPAELVRAEHYDGYRRQLYARVGLPFAPGSGPVAELPR